MKKSKIICYFPLFIMLGILLCEATSFLSCKDNNLTIGSPVVIETIDDNNTKLHCNNVIAENKDFLFTKKMNEKGYHYSIADLKTQKEICNFDSVQNVDLNDSDLMSLKSQQMCAAVGGFVWAVVHGQSPFGAISAAFGSASGLISAGTLGAMVSLVAECGLASVPAVIGLLSTSEAIMLALGVGGLA